MMLLTTEKIYILTTAKKGEEFSPSLRRTHNERQLTQCQRNIWNS